MTSLGIDIGGTSVKAALRRDGRVVWARRGTTYHGPGREELVSAVRGAVRGAEGVGAVGLCVPGLLDAGRKCVALSVNVPGLVGVPLAELIAQAVPPGPGGVLGVPPFALLSDANAAALDVYAGRRLDGRLLLLAIGTGVGAAVRDAGGPLFVDGESPGHLGQCDVSLDDNPPVGPDGGAGGLEAYLGRDALVRQYGAGVLGDLSLMPFDAPPVRALARAVRLCHAIYRPRHVCLAGGVGSRLGPWLPALRARIETGLTRVADPRWTLAVADDDFHAARGAARFAESRFATG